VKKAEFEAVLLDCEQFKRLCEERKSCFSCTPRRASSAPSTRLRQLSSPAGTRDSTKSDAAAEFSKKFYSLNDLYRAGTSDVRRDPTEALRVSMEHYREKPSLTSATQLEMAINRLGIASAPDEKTKKLINRAIAVLGERIEDKGNSGFKGDNIAVTLWVDANSQGSQLFANLSYGGTLTGWVDLSSVNFDNKISSLTLQVSADEVGGRVFLFQNERFLGRYVQFDAPPGAENDVPYVGGYINDRTSSLLIYRRFANEVIQSVGEIVPPGTIKSLIDSTAGITSRGEPVFTWDLFPMGEDGHPNEPSTMFIYIRIPITVDVPHWFDYDAEIRFWVSPFVDENGLLQAPLNYYGAWVESGILSSDILDQLMGDQGIPSVLGQVTNLLSSAASVANLAATFSSLYLLPGRNAAMGYTDDDVTIVLLQGPPPVAGPIL